MCLTKIAGVCVLAAQITHGGTYSTPEMGFEAELINANTHEVTTISTKHLYEDEQTNFYVGGSLYLENTRLSLGYNSGIDTAKFDVSKAYTIGIDQVFGVTDKLDVILSGSTTIGGEARHTVCTDQRGLEFNCLNPLSPKNARQELDEMTPEHKTPYNLGVKLRYKF